MSNKDRNPQAMLYLKGKGSFLSRFSALHEAGFSGQKVGQKKATVLRSVKIGIGTLLVGAALFGASLVLREGTPTAGKEKEVFW